MRIITAIACIAVAVALAFAGCKKTRFGAGCKKAVDMTAPWTELALPIDGDKTRVCESGVDKLKLRSYQWSSTNAATAAFEEALVGQGYTKERCNQMSCSYAKGDAGVRVQPIDFKVKNKKMVTVVLTATTKRR